MKDSTLPDFIGLIAVLVVCKFGHEFYKPFRDTQNNRTLHCPFCKVNLDRASFEVEDGNVAAACGEIDEILSNWETDETLFIRSAARKWINQIEK